MPLSEQSRSVQSMNQKPISFDFLTPKYKEEKFKVKAEDDYRRLEVKLLKNNILIFGIKLLDYFQE
jgi:hypothetical protein